MPKETFFNLPADKREHITAIAVDEFANHDYANVSISRIVARAGIAKGSFYQYFKDKEDLYDYLLQLIVEKKKEIMSLDHPDPQQVGIFRYLHWLLQAGVQFELVYPDLVHIGWRAARNGSLPALQARYRGDTLAFYKLLVAKGKEQGDIHPDIDEELAAFIFDAIFAGMTQQLIPYITAHKEHEGKGQALFQQPAVARIFDQTIDMLEAAMNAPARVPGAGSRSVPELVQQEGVA